MKKLGLLALAVMTLAACTEQPVEKKVTAPTKKGPEAPFRFHRAVEVKPGLTYDILSWGRGNDSVGAYLILRSDSTHSRYRCITGELEGKLTDAWDMDMDSDGNPELVMQLKKGSKNDLMVFEFAASGLYNEITFPGVSGSSKKGYEGHDSLFVKDGIIIREFPLFQKENEISKPTGERRTLEYKLRNNRFSVTEQQPEKKEAPKSK